MGVPSARGCPGLFERARSWARPRVARHFGGRDLRRRGECAPERDLARALEGGRPGIRTPEACPGRGTGGGDRCPGFCHDRCRHLPRCWCLVQHDLHRLLGDVGDLCRRNLRRRIRSRLHARSGSRDCSRHRGAFRTDRSDGLPSSLPTPRPGPLSEGVLDRSTALSERDGAPHLRWRPIAQLLWESPTCVAE